MVPDGPTGRTTCITLYPEASHHIPKGALKHLGHNPNARAAHNYSIIDDLGQTPYAMSALEVL